MHSFIKFVKSLFYLFIMASGVGLSLLFLPEALKSPKDFLPVEATITSSEASNQSIQTLGPRSRNVAQIIIKYDYFLEGKGYASQKYMEEVVFPTRLFISPEAKQQVDALLVKYAPGNKLIVYYDPSDPEGSYLDNSIKIELGNWAMIAVGALIFLGGLGMFYQEITDKKT